MTEEVLSELEPWKKKRFRKGDLRLGDVVASIIGGEAMVDVRPSRASQEQWCLFNKKTNNVAILTYAVVFLWGSPTETGNFVPPDESPPDDLPSTRVQTVASSFCELSFAFDTSADCSLYSHLETLEQLVVANPEFNKHGKPNRNWQSYANPTTNHRYVATAKLFMRKTPFNAPANIPYRVHPWIQAVGDDPASRWMPNKDRPCLLHYQQNKTPRFVPIEYGRGGLQKGDLLWMSFIVTFSMRAQGWSTSLIPLDLIRVGKIDVLPSHREAPPPAVIEQSDYRPIQGGIEDDELGVDEDSGDESEAGNSKRKRAGVPSSASVSTTASDKGNDSESDGQWVGVERDVARMDIDDTNPVSGRAGAPPTKRRANRSTRRVS